ncbi:MAG TPA: hypothetical protein VFZ97_18710 [Acidimicrobiales bacterium]
MLRRGAVLIIRVALAAASVALVVSVLTGSARGAGADPPTTKSPAPTTAPPTTHCVLCGPTTTLRVPPTTLPPGTSPATSSPAQTTPTTRPTARTLAPYTGQTYPPTTVAPPTTLTTIPPIGGHLPVSPQTLPFATKQQSSHVSPVFAALSGVGFFVALLIAGLRFLLTRPRKQ